MPALLRQPTHTLLQKQHADPEYAPGHQLQTDGNLPLPINRRNMLLHTVVDPVRGHDPQGEEELEHAAEHPTDLLGGHFRAEHGHHDGRHADADAADDAGGIESADGVSGRDLDDSADAED